MPSISVSSHRVVELDILYFHVIPTTLFEIPRRSEVRPAPGVAQLAICYWPFAVRGRFRRRADTPIGRCSNSGVQNMSILITFKDHLANAPLIRTVSDPAVVM